MAEVDPGRRIKRLVDDGELLHAIDEARRLAPTLEEEGLRQSVQIEEVIALARMGSLDEAQERYTAYQLSASADTSARSLDARLNKDLGFAAAPSAEAEHFLRRSRDIYLSIAADHAPDGPTPDRSNFEYNAINAVTLSRFLNDMAAVGGVVADLQAEEPLDSYYSWATRAELLLVLKAPIADIGHALRTARTMPGAEPGPIATTLNQLSRIDAGNAALAELRPGPVLHYSGHMIAAPGQAHGRVLAENESELKRRIEERLEAISPSVVFGSLASGVDILVVEWALRTGRAARIFLPFRDDDFFRESVLRAGSNWGERGRACLASDRCKVSYLTQAPQVEHDAQAFAAVSCFAMGSAILQAERDFAFAEQLVVWDGEDLGGVAGAAADRRCWPSDRYRQHDINVSDLGAKAPSSAVEAQSVPNAVRDRTPKALIFGDVKNFSKLAEHQLPDFVALVMGAAREVFDEVDGEYPGSLRLSNTWGDGIFAVFDHAAPAAAFALGLQHRMTAMAAVRDERGLPPDLAIRLGLHYGVVYPLEEPVTGRPNFFGEAVARAARIEPITVAGRTFVTEEFASALALEGNSPAIAEYVGEVESHKDYGRFRLYRIRPLRNGKT